MRRLGLVILAGGQVRNRVLTKLVHGRLWNLQPFLEIEFSRFYLFVSGFLIFFFYLVHFCVRQLTAMSVLADTNGLVWCVGSSTA